MSSGNNGAGFPLDMCVRVTKRGELMLQPFLQRGAWQCPAAPQPLFLRNCPLSNFFSPLKWSNQIKNH